MTEKYSINLSQLQGYRLSLFERDHETTPYIVCAVGPDDEPLLECGYDAFIELDSPQMALQDTYSRFRQVIALSQFTRQR